MMFSNWQLALLGATAIALSLASGYTTFDGLRNFTSAPLLSVLIAFGIQGVMLIVAWLIGESFATGMNQRTAERQRASRAREATIGMLLGVALAGLGVLLAAQSIQRRRFHARRRTGRRLGPLRRRRALFPDRASC